MLSTTVTVGIPNGSKFWIRWDDADNTSGDHGLAIDDFSLSWTTASVAVPPTLTANVAELDFGTLLQGSSALPTRALSLTNATGATTTGDIFVQITGADAGKFGGGVPATTKLTGGSSTDATVALAVGGASAVGTFHAKLVYTTTPAMSAPLEIPLSVMISAGGAFHASDSTQFGAMATGVVAANTIGAGLTTNTLGLTAVGAGHPAAIGTTAMILYLNNFASATPLEFTTQWRTRTLDEASQYEAIPGPADGKFLLSDVLNVSGTGSNTFVLQMSYDPTLLSSNYAAELGVLFLAWKNSQGEWVNAVAGNTLGTSTYANAGGDTSLSWTDAGSPTTLGTWGVDTDNHVVWAVLNHNSEFAVIPEPSVWLASGLLGVAPFYLRRRRRTPA